MDITIPTLEALFYLIGEATVIILASAVIVAFVLVVISLYSIKSGKLYFPRTLKAGLALLEGLMQAMFRLTGLEDREMLAFFITLQNALHKAAFERIPVGERAIFMPQCLRSSECPAHLTPEGLECRACGRCTVGQAQKMLRAMGYRTFIVPGSSFIKRMVKKYRPRAILGIGCLTEVKEGIEMADSIGLVAMGVVNLREGCVETVVDWDDVYEVAKLGIDPNLIPKDLHTLTD